MLHLISRSYRAVSAQCLWASLSRMLIIIRFFNQQFLWHFFLLWSFFLKWYFREYPNYIRLRRITCLRAVIRLLTTDNSFRYKSGVQTNYYVVAKFVFTWFVCQHLSKTCWQTNQIKTIFGHIIRLNTGFLPRRIIRPRRQIVWDG